MNLRQIILVIINEKLYKMGEIDKETKDKITLEIQKEKNLN